MADAVAPAAGAGSDIVLERLTRLHPRIIDLTLDRVWRLLDLVGNPQERLPPVVHVAGTNGKGSVIAGLRAMAEAGGMRTHVYTSPHLVRLHERIRLAATLIEETELVALLEHCEAVNGPDPITFFEVTTVAAMLAFSRVPADLLLLEVGLGGRLDATNVIARPALSVITPISLDHQQYLGDSLEQIAFEKAGVLKPDVPAVIAPQLPKVMATIEAQAERTGAPLLRGGVDWQFERQQDGLLLDGERFPLPALRGAHQAENAATAIVAARRLQSLDPAFRFNILTGLKDMQWPARLQRLAPGAHSRKLPEGWEIWLDGGHNAAAGQALAAELANWTDRPTHVIYGLLNSKAAADFLAPIVPHAVSLQAIAIPGEPNSLSAAEAAAAAAGAIPRASLDEAFAELDGAAGPARVLICGSLYLAGRVLGNH